MRRYLKIPHLFPVLIAAGMMAWGFCLSGAEARTVVVGTRPNVVNPYYSSPYYYGPQPVVVEPVLLPRTGSNDYQYQYDNIYGAGASAAGRLSHVVVNPPPYVTYSRQPRLYLGY